MDESKDGNTSNTSIIGSGRKRGHQHHIRNSGTRPSTVRADEVIAALRRGDQLPVTQQYSTMQQHLTDDNTITANKQLFCDDDNGMTDQNGNNDTLIDDLNKNNRLTDVTKCILIDSTNEQLNKKNVISKDSEIETQPMAVEVVGPLNSDIDMELLVKDELNESISSNSSSSSRSKTKRSKKNRTGVDSGSAGGVAKKERRSKKTKNLPPAEERPPLEGADADQWNENDSTVVDMENDPEAAEWSKLRCTSERAEVVAEREYRRQNRRCADYPGLAFGRSIFSSDTMMKYNIIRNELHNIMKTQLKRVCVIRRRHKIRQFNGIFG